MALDNHQVVGLISTNMSKAFDSLYHLLLLAKLRAYGLGDSSLQLMRLYFTDPYNRVKLGPVVSNWNKVLRGCPQGSALGPMIWNIFQNDMTYNMDYNINMYADDHQFYAISNCIEHVYNILIQNARLASEWYYAKYRIMAFGKGRNEMESIIVDDHGVKPTCSLELLGVIIDNKLRFDQHIHTVCKKSSQRVGALMRLRNLIPTSTKMTLFKAVILPHLTYCHHVWHFCRESDNRKLERIQERALRAVYCDKLSSYSDLLANLCTLKNGRIQDMAILMHKVKNNFRSGYITSLFRSSNNKYNLRNNDYALPRFNTVTFGKHSLRYSKTSFEKNCFSAWASTLNMGLINKVDMVCLSPVGYGV